jgi:hypothetical protein
MLYDDNHLETDFIEVTWQLSYSGRTPAKFLVTELMPRQARVKHHESDYKLAKAHDSAELWSWFLSFQLIGH